MILLIDFENPSDSSFVSLSTSQLDIPSGTTKVTFSITLLRTTVPPAITL